MRIANANRPVRAGKSGGAGEAPGLARELGQVAGGAITPFALHIGHEAQLVDAISVVEPIHRHGAVAEGEQRRKLNVGEWVTRGWPGEGEFKDFPLRDGAVRCVGR